MGDGIDLGLGEPLRDLFYGFIFGLEEFDDLFKSPVFVIVGRYGDVDLHELVVGNIQVESVSAILSYS